MVLTRSRAALRLTRLRYLAIEGNSPVRRGRTSVSEGYRESCCLGLQHKMGGIFHLNLNIRERPIANKYREGKMKRTLKRMLKVREIVR